MALFGTVYPKQADPGDWLLGGLLDEDPQNMMRMYGAPRMTQTDRPEVDPRFSGQAGTTLQERRPHMGEKVTQFLNENVYGDTREGEKFASRLGAVARLPLGLLESGYEVGRAAAEGDSDELKMQLAMALAPGAPQALKSAAHDVAKAAAGKARERAVAAFQQAVREHHANLPKFDPSVSPTVAETARFMSAPQLNELYPAAKLSDTPATEFAQRSLLATPTEQEFATAKARKEADRAYLNKLSSLRVIPVKTKKGTVMMSERDLAKKGSGGYKLPSVEEKESGPHLAETLRLKKEREAAEPAAEARRGELFDISGKTLNRQPEREQFQMPRVGPAEDTELTRLIGRGGFQRAERAARNASEENFGWYNQEQWRQVFHDLLGKDKGEQAFQAWTASIAGTSMQQEVPANIRMGSYLYGKTARGEALPQRLDVYDPEMPARGKDGKKGGYVKTMVGEMPPGYGHYNAIQQTERVKQFLQNQWDPVDNPKPMSFYQNLMGNWEPTTVDIHEIRNQAGMPQGLLHPSPTLPEYTALEDVGRRVAKKMGVSPAQRQAATWIGGGKYTNLGSPPVPFLQALEQRILTTAEIRGQHPEDVIRDLIINGVPLQ